MSSETKYKCNFCDKIIVPDATPAGSIGYCLNDKLNDNDCWTSKLNLNRSGPHICGECVEFLNAFLERN